LGITIDDLWTKGLSRREIRTALNNQASERYIRERTERFSKWPFSYPEENRQHRQGMKDLREKTAGFFKGRKQKSLTPQKDFAEIKFNKAVGRGEYYAGKRGELSEEEIDAYWKARARNRHEGS
jgi:hypothetical protein